MVNTDKKNFVRILGPCSVQSEDVYLGTAEKLYPIMKGKDWYYKASFDKANRTSIYGGRGPGLEDSIRLFKEVKKLYPDIKLTTDVHEPWQCDKLAGIIDLVQIPAFLCKQTDLIIASAQNFDKMNIKKGQWLGPQNLIKSVDKGAISASFIKRRTVPSSSNVFFLDILSLLVLILKMQNIFWFCLVVIN